MCLPEPDAEVEVALSIFLLGQPYRTGMNTKNKDQGDYSGGHSAESIVGPCRRSRGNPEVTPGKGNKRQLKVELDREKWYKQHTPLSETPDLP